MNGIRIVRAACGALLLLLIAACSHDVPLAPSYTPTADSPAVPEKVGIYLSEEFRTFEHKHSFGGDTWVFPLGAASTPLFEQAFNQVFDGAFAVGSLPPFEPARDDLAAVIEPRIEEFSAHIPLFKTQTYSASIAYRFVLHDAKGEPIASWLVNGEGAQAGEFGFEFAKWPGRAADLAMEDAAQKFSRSILEEPEVRRWLKGRERLISGVPGIAYRLEEAR